LFWEYLCHRDQFCSFSWPSKKGNSRENYLFIRVNAWNIPLVRCTPLDVCFTSMMISDVWTFLRCEVYFGRTSRPTGLTGRAEFGSVDEPSSDHTLTGRRGAGSSLFVTRPGALYSPRRLLHVDGDFADFVGGRISSNNTWDLGISIWLERAHCRSPSTTHPTIAMRCVSVLVLMSSAFPPRLRFPSAEPCTTCQDLVQLLALLLMPDTSKEAPRASLRSFSRI